MTKAIKGNTTICEVSPINKVRGKRKRFLKLADVSDIPTPSIINARMELRSKSMKE